MKAVRGKKSQRYQPSIVGAEQTDSSLKAQLSLLSNGQTSRELDLRARSILENTTAALFILLDLNISYANPAACLLSGYSETELLGFPFLDLIHPDYRQEISQALIAKTPAASSSPLYKAILLSKNGRERWLELELNRFNYDGQSACLITAFDITERHIAENILQDQVAEHEKTRQELELSLHELQVAEEELRFSNNALYETQNRLEQERQRYQNLFEFAPDGYLVTDAYGIFQEVNLAAARLLGIEQKYLIGKPITVYFVREQHRALFNLLKELQKHGGVQSGEFTLRSRSQQKIPVDLAVSASPDPKNSGLTLRWILRDITFHKQAEEAIRQNTARVSVLSEISQVINEANLDEHAILDSIARVSASAIGGVCIVRTVSLNRKCLDAVALYPARTDLIETLNGSLDFLRQNASSWIAVQLFQSSQAVLLPEVSLEKDLSGNQLQLDPYQEYFKIISAVVVPLRIEGVIVGTVSLYRNNEGLSFTTEDQVLLQTLADRAGQAVHNARLYRELQDLLKHEQDLRSQLIQAEKLAAMGRMLASVTHEINNPLQTIKNCLFLIKGDLNGESSTNEYLSMAMDEADRLSRLVAQLRQTYRASSLGHLEALVLVDLLNDISILLSGLLHDYHIKWILDRSGADLTNLKVEGFSDQLKQVFLNICLNAVDSMQPDGGELSVDFLLSADGRFAGVKFHDTGSGISGDTISRLFEPFFTTKPKGLGLGLAICYDIVNQHKGRIEVESQVGEGADFTVWLPVLKNQAGADG